MFSVPQKTAPVAWPEMLQATNAMQLLPLSGRIGMKSQAVRRPLDKRRFRLEVLNSLHCRTSLPIVIRLNSEVLVFRARKRGLAKPQPKALREHRRRWN